MRNKMSISIPDNIQFYRQEGEIIPFTCMPWVQATIDLDDDFFDADYKHIYGFFQQEYGWAYWDKGAFDILSESVYQKYGHNKNIDELYAKYQANATEIEQLFLNHSLENLLDLSVGEMQEFFVDLTKKYHAFWQTSLFIDSFDAGYDQEKIEEVADEYNLSQEEITILTTPREMTFEKERKLELLKLTQRYRNQEQFDNVDEFCKNSQYVKDYITKFNYHKSTYANIEHISVTEVVSEMKKYLENPDDAKETFEELSSYSTNQKEAEKDVLDSHDLKENPLYFFQKLTYWREHRKKINLMGIHLLHYTLSYIQSKTEVPHAHLACLKYDNVSDAIAGEVEPDVLKRRFEDGFFLALDPDGGLQTAVGDEAERLRDICKEKLAQDDDVQKLSGMAASSGKASGEVRIIMSQENFEEFEEGEVLVTGMTRPEFVSTMKKSAAIITNEGGITSHAAIVSRELNKPCVIGTQNATEVLQDGDRVEVDADEGVVKIIDKKQK
jgi:phosphohistidine swiveling domain-containing protein